MLGLAAIRQSRYDDSVKYFREAIEAGSSGSDIAFSARAGARTRGKTDEARPELEKTSELDPLRDGAQYQLATYARKAGDQQAFRRYMRNYERIRKIKGPANALALEECRYTKPEAVDVQSPAQPPDTPPPESIAALWKGDAVAGSPPLMAAAVLALEDSGQYSWSASLPAAKW